MVPAVQIAMPTSRAVTIRSTSTGVEGATIYVEGNSRIVIKDSGKIVGIAIKKTGKGEMSLKGKGHVSLIRSSNASVSLKRRSVFSVLSPE